MLGRVLSGGFEAWANRFWPLLGAFLLFTALVLIPTEIILVYEWNLYGDDAPGLWSNVVSVLLTAILSRGFYLTFLRAVRGERPRVGEVLAYPLDFWKYLVAGLLYAAVVAAGFLLLILPGLYLLVRLSFFPYAIADGLGPLEALSKSWQLTKGQFWGILGLFFVQFLVLVAGIIALLVGILPAATLATAFQANYYARLAETPPIEEKVSRP